MILRKTQIVLFVVIICIDASFAEDPPSTNYDTNDWIPIAQPEAAPPEKKAQARVLNLSEPPQKNFFPEETQKPQQQQFQQYLRETTMVNPYAVRAQYTPQVISSAPREQPYRFEIAQLKQVPQKAVDEVQQQYYLQPQPIRQHFAADTQFVMRPIPASILQQTEPQQVPQAPRPKVQYQQILMQPQQQFIQQPQQYHTIPQEYLSLPFIPQPEIYDQQYHTLPVPHQVSPFKVKAPANKTKTYLTRPLVEQPPPPPPPPQKQKDDKENIQLVYVPLESLKQGNEYQRPQLVPQIAAPKPPLQRVVNHRQQQIKNIESDFAKQALEAHKLQVQFQQDPAPAAYTLPASTSTNYYQTTTTTSTTRRPTIKKRKPHQPPLAVYMGSEGEVEVSDVLAVLKNAKSIDVQDSFGPHSPQVFVGPSSLEAPDGYAKFELPYLSSIDNNRVERKVDQLPFFVAPLSYKAPLGYSKIPLPSPHVGSVVVSTKGNNLHDKNNVPAQTLPTRPNSPYDFNSYYTDNPSTTRTYVTSTTTTTPSPPPSRSPTRQHPVNQVVNQYEIDQINNQFIPSTQYQYESFPESKYQEYETAAPQQVDYIPVRSTTPQPTIVNTTPAQPKVYSSRPTQSTFVEASDDVTGKYTVLEEFHANGKSVTSDYDKYNSQEPVEYYSTNQPQPIYTRTSLRPSDSQHLLSQDMMDYQILRTRPTEDSQKSRYKPVQITSTESSHSRKTAKPLIRPQVKPGDYYLEDPNLNSKYTDSTEEQSRYKESENVSNRPSQANANKQYLSEAYYHQGTDSDKGDEYYNLPSLLPPVSQSLPGLINELQDQSLKSLLVPALLAPTTSKNINYDRKQTNYVDSIGSTPSYVVATSEATTEAPIAETTTRKNRGRQRGNRYTTAATTSDATRRTIARGRRPYTSRTREEPVSSTTEYSDNYSEPRKTVPNGRSRFRTRSRPTSTEQSERSTTPAIEEVPVLPARNRNINALNSYQIEEQSIRPQVQKYEEQYLVPVSNYQPIYNTNVEQEGVSESIRQSTRQQLDETTDAVKSKPRTRIRSRTKPTTTPAPAPETERSVDDSKDLYGFIRVPNYKKPSEVSADSRETQKYSSTYVSSTLRPTIQYPDEELSVNPKEVRYYIQEQISPSSTPVYFIGEIRPKYQPGSSTRDFVVAQEVIGSTDRYVATTPSEYATEPTKARGRVRIPGRIRDNNEDVTIKTTRTRTRGKSHYKPPQSLTNKKHSDDVDVEGGNYPESYLRSKENYTPRPSFQITVDPGDDQVPHSSIYQPKYVPQNPDSLLNNIPVDTKQSYFDQHTTELTPTALPYISYERNEDSVEDLSTDKLDITQDALNILDNSRESTIPTMVSITPEESTPSSIEEITKVKKPHGRRRGVWKLVKQRPVEVFEGAESQSLSGNKNSIDMTLNKNTYNGYQVTEDTEVNTPLPASTTEALPQTTSAEINTPESTDKSESLFDSLYEMFGITQTQEPAEDLKEQKINSTEAVTESTKIETTTEKASSENLDEFIITTSEAEELTTPKEATKPKEETTLTSDFHIVETSSTEAHAEQEDVQTTTMQPMSYVTPMSLHTWTSTSTEISHETEICYKGKCVKSKETK